MPTWIVVVVYGLVGVLARFCNCGLIAVAAGMSVAKAAVEESKSPGCYIKSESTWEITDHTYKLLDQKILEQDCKGAVVDRPSGVAHTYKREDDKLILYLDFPAGNRPKPQAHRDQKVLCDGVIASVYKKSK